MRTWNSSGDLARSVVRAVRDGIIDERFLAAAPSTVSKEGAGGADGGYAVPVDCRKDITAHLLGDDSLLGLCDLRRATSNSISVPGDVQPPWSSSGPQVELVELEGTALAQSKLKIEARNLRLARASVLLPVSNELLEAGGDALTAYINQSVGLRFAHVINNWLINGDGLAGKPVGLLNAPCKVTQTKESGQTAATIVLANTQKMLTRLPAFCRPTAIWVAHPETEPQLSALGVPNWNPNGPRPLLHGLPVYFQEAAAPLGGEGDLSLVDFGSYLAAVRAHADGQDIAQAISTELWFDQHLSALRFTMRVSGTPWFAAAWARFKTATTVSPIVTLEAR